MAKDAKPAEGAEEAPKKKSKKLLIIIIAAAVVVLGIGGTAAFFLMHKSADHGDDEEVASEKDKPKKKKSEKDTPPAFVSLEPFTVNLKQEQGDQYLQATISVEVEDAHVGDKLKVYMPKIRSRILNILAEKKPSELMTKEGKDLLAEAIKAEINDAMGAPEAKGKKSEGPIREVLFTSFIIQ